MEVDLTDVIYELRAIRYVLLTAVLVLVLIWIGTMAK